MAFFFKFRKISAIISSLMFLPYLTLILLGFLLTHMLDCFIYFLQVPRDVFIILIDWIISVTLVFWQTKINIQDNPFPWLVVDAGLPARNSTEVVKHSTSMWFLHELELSYHGKHVSAPTDTDRSHRASYELA